MLVLVYILIDSYYLPKEPGRLSAENAKGKVKALESSTIFPSNTRTASLLCTLP